MAITPGLSHKLRQTLGEEAARDLVTWMEEKDAQGGGSALHLGMQELRQEIQVGFATMRQEMAVMEARFERRFSDLVKWSFLFWVGAVVAIAVLAGAVP